jgi:hypothetical protein
MAEELHEIPITLRDDPLYSLHRRFWSSRRSTFKFVVWLVLDVAGAL